jgi:hypothetical protein
MTEQTAVRRSYQCVRPRPCSPASWSVPVFGVPRCSAIRAVHTVRQALLASRLSAAVVVVRLRQVRCALMIPALDEVVPRRSRHQLMTY